MRIAFITRSAFGILGGADSYLMPAHVAGHHDVRVLSPVSAVAAEEVVYRNPRLDVRTIHWQNAAELAGSLYGELRDFAPDVVHLFHSRHGLRLLHALRGLLPGTKWVMDFRSPPVVETREAMYKVRLRYFLCQFYVDRVLTHSLLTLRDNVPLRFRPVTEIPPGVELDRIAPRAAPAAAPRRFLYVGSLAGVRRLDLLVQGFAKFARGRAEQPSLTLVGGGNAVPGLRALIERERLGDIVNMPGTLPQEAVYGLLAEHDAGIAWVPDELFGNAPSLKMLEYSAAGLPFAASDTPGHRDYATRFGFRFVPFDNTAAGVARGLQRLCESDPARDARANREAVARFDWKHIVEHDLLPVYETLCRGRGRTMVGAGAQ